MNQQDQILVLNCGSSSVKYALYAGGVEPTKLWAGAIERIGLEGARFHARDSKGSVLFDEDGDIPDHKRALALLLAAVEARVGWQALAAVGHRIAHGGPHCDCPMWVDDALEQRLHALISLAPLHLPHNLAGIAQIKAERPALPQAACFDTAFHHALPRVARMTGLPRSRQSSTMRRYGFHGLSYEYVLEELGRRDGARPFRERVIVAHLGNGASMAAIREGRSVETTMGFSGLSGLLMGTRCGDFDPGLMLYLLRQKGITVAALERLLYEESGLLGISGISRNMQDLLQRQDLPVVVEAIELFCYRARTHLAALTAALGGLDRLVFTGGIGANAPEIRERICAGLTYLGIAIDLERNRRQETTISTSASAVKVEAFPSDEELMIARHTDRLLGCTPDAREARHG